MDDVTAEGWRNLFENWPASMPRRGVIVTSFDPAIPFNGYLFSGGLLLVERDKPDANGTRKVVIPYSAILGLKITDVVELARYQAMGFHPPL